MNTASISALGASAKPLAEHIARFCEQQGIGVEFRKTGKHPCAELTFNRRSRKVFFSGTPSDWRLKENVIRDVKKTARELGWEPKEETEMERPVVKSLRDLPQIAVEPEHHSLKVPTPDNPAKKEALGACPQIPSAWRGKSIRGNIRDPELHEMLAHRNEWVRRASEAGVSDEKILASVRQAGWDIQTLGAVAQMAARAGGYKAPTVRKPAPERVEITHQVTAIDPLVLAIAEAIAPLLKAEMKALKAKADKWDAISGLVREA